MTRKLVFMFISVLIIVFLALLLVSIAKSDTSSESYLPLIYYPNQPSPESNWPYIHHADEIDDDVKVYVQVPGHCWELKVQKIGKTLWVRTYKVGDCESDPPPPWPLPSDWEWIDCCPLWEWGTLKSVKFEGSAQKACSDYYSDKEPTNCVKVRKK